MLYDHAGMGLEKAKDHLEFNLLKDVNDNKKRFYKYVNKRKAILWWGHH